MGIRAALLCGALVALSPRMLAQTNDGVQVRVALAPLIEEAKRRHAERASARGDARAAWHVQSRVARLPDPFVFVGAQNQRLDDPGLTTPMSAFQLGVVQPFPAPVKLSARRDAAKAMARTGDRYVELLETRVALEVQRAYWRLSYAEAALEVSIQSERVIDTLTNAVHARFSVAQAAQQDALQAQTAHRRLRAELRRRRQQVLSARRTLNAAVGRAPSGNLEEYDLDLALRVIADTDLWLNTPQWPLEASGTSGMKAAHNGVPSFSVLDGWWRERHIESATGWSIGASEPGNDDGGDARDLYDQREQRLLPRFYDQRAAWVHVMQQSIALNANFFNTHRMVRHSYALRDET